MRKNPKILPGHTKKESRENKTPRFSLGKILKFVFFIGLISGLIYFFIYSNFFNISKLIIEETNFVDRDEIEEIAYQHLTKENKNIWQFDGYQLEKEIKNTFPLVGEVIIQKGVPDTLRIKIKEREPALIWDSGEKKYLIDQEGFAFSKLVDYQEKKEQFLADLLTVNDKSQLPVEVGQKLVSSHWVDFIGAIDNKLIEDLKLPAQEYFITETAFDLNVVSPRGRILVDTNRSAEEQISALEIALENIDQENFEYVDLRISGWVYYQ